MLGKVGVLLVGVLLVGIVILVGLVGVLLAFVDVGWLCWARLVFYLMVWICWCSTCWTCWTYWTCWCPTCWCGRGLAVLGEVASVSAIQRAIKQQVCLLMCTRPYLLLAREGRALCVSVRGLRWAGVCL